MIKTVIFDIGGVLIDFDWYELIMKQNNNDCEKTEQIIDAFFGHGVWSENDRGVWTEEQLLDGFIKAQPKLKAEILNFWNHAGETQRQSVWTKDWIKNLKERGYQVLYLSNWSKHMREQCEKQLDFLPLMDGGIFSYLVKSIKPERRIYELLIERYNLNPKESVFIDDSMPNIEAAAECGLHTIFASNHEKAAEELEKMLSENNQ